MYLQRLFSLLVLLISSMLASLALAESRLTLGTIQFPAPISKIPTIRIYCGGRIIPCSLDQCNKTITFSIPKYVQQHHFNILITEKIGFVHTSSKYQSEMHNTPAYLRLEAGQSYKLYSALLVPEFSDEQSTKLQYMWRVKEEKLQENNLKIPDDAIIVCYNPEWIESIQGTNTFELPTLKISSNIIELCGSEEAFYNRSTEIMLASLDSDTIHAIQKEQYVQLHENRITIAAPTT